jgi:DNA-binding NtrC family response regulator
VSRVLVIDDDAAVAFALERFLREAGHAVEVAPTAERGLELARRNVPELVLLDLRLPAMQGAAALAELRRDHPELPIIVVTAHGSAETAMDALAAGAFDHLTKPFDLAELRRAVERALVRGEPKAAVAPETTSAALVGRSRAMQDVGKRIGILARCDASVLVRGESGTGKEHVARAIHERSARSAAPFAPIVCAALPETLLEAELFGALKGSFTGATRDRTGRLEASHGGTVFLDEVGEIAPAAQVKILRFLEDRKVEPLGGGAPRTVDVRIIAATNADLEARVRDGRFREDLYYRLNVVTIELPALRDRREDVPLLVQHFLARAQRGGTSVDALALERLVSAPWPGNVRELRNAVEHALALARGGTILVDHLPPAVLEASPRPLGELDPLAQAVGAVVERTGGRPGLHEELVRAVEKAAIARALELTGGNQVAAAKLLDMNRTTFRKRMEEHGLESG